MQVTRHVAIVGGGFSGVALASALLRRSPRALRISLLESGFRIGRGIAYGTTSSVHLLNTRAAQMSLFDDDPEHFVRWCRTRGRALHGTEFVRRRDYGDYVEESFRSLCGTVPDADLAVRLGTTVADIARCSDGFELVLDGGEVMWADTVVLATGHPRPADPLAAWLPRESPRYLRDPWQLDALDAIAPHDRVLLLGTALTAMDVVLALDERGHDAPIAAVSRRGLVPEPHRARPDALPRRLRAKLLAGLGRNDLRTMLRVMRETAAAAEECGVGWQAVFDAVRPATQRVWAALCAADRRRFVRRLRPYWDAHRHRLPSAAAARIAVLRDGGRLTVRPGRLCGARIEGDALCVELGTVRAAAPQTELYDWVVNCTGASFAKAESRPLERRLFERGLLLPDPLGLGFVTADDGAVIGAHGPVPGLFVLGPGCRPNVWEQSAVPEIRAQAPSLAAEIGARPAARRWRKRVASGVLSARHPWRET